MDWTTLIALGGLLLTLIGFMFTLAGLMWRIAHNTGETNTKLGHLSEVCDDMRKRLDQQTETNAEHSGKLQSIETTLVHHDRRLDEHHEAIHEIRNHHRGRP